MSESIPVASARSAHCEGASYLSTTPLSSPLTVFGLLSVVALTFGVLLLP